MTDFRTKKDKLLSELNSEVESNPENDTLKSLYQILKSYNSVSELDGTLSHTVVDSLGFEYRIGEKLIEFENYCQQHR